MKTPLMRLVSDELGAAIAPLLPPERPKPRGGRPRVPDRAVLAGILFVLQGGIGWESLPPQLGCGSGMTCRRRLRDWHEAGVWEGLHRALLQRLADADELDWSRASLDSGLDSASVAAERGAPRRGRTRRTGAGRAASGASSSTAMASRSR